MGFDFSTGGWAALLVASDWIIRFAMLPVVPARRSPEAAKGWLLLIFFLPWVGLVLYLVIGRPSLPKWRLTRLAEFPELLAPIRERLHALPALASPPVDPAFAPGVKLATALGGLPITGGNRVELLDDYDATVARMVADIEAAESSVHLSFYIFGDDAVTARVIDALARATSRGVRARVLMDGYGSRPYRKRVLPKLAAAGVAARVALPLRFGRKASRFDLRNHRKIVVVDGRIGYTGSQNLVAANFKAGLEYSELMVRVEGPLVLQLQAVFASDWYVESGESVGEDAFPDPVSAGPVAAQILPSGPADPVEEAQRLAVNLIHAATSRVVVVTPYFVPDAALLQALETAVKRGAEVHLVVDQRIDQPLVGNAQRSYYDELLAAGIAIHAYGKAFLHAKSISIDGQVAWIGSCNMDIRSFALNEEVVALFYDREVCAELARIEAGYMAGAQRIDAAAWARRPAARRLIENLARLVSPLL